MITLNLFQYLPTIQYSIIVDQSEDNVLCNSYLNDLCLYYTENIKALQFLLFSQVHIENARIKETFFGFFL